MTDESNRKGGLDGSDDPESSQEQVPASEMDLDTDDIEENNDRNQTERTHAADVMASSSDRLNDALEEGARVEGKAKGSVEAEALRAGLEMAEAQEEIREEGRNVRQMAGAMKLDFENEVEEREAQVSINGETVESEYGDFESGLDEAVDEATAASHQREKQTTLTKNNERVQTATGEVPMGREEAADTAGDVWMAADSNAEEKQQGAVDAINNLLTEVDHETQESELRERVDQYEEFKGIVEDAVDTIQSADTEVTTEDANQALREVAAEYGIDDLDDLEDHSATSEYIQEIAEQTGLEDEVVTSVTTDLTELFGGSEFVVETEDGEAIFDDESEVDPVEALRHVKASAADSVARQVERYETAEEAVEEVRSEILEVVSSYDEFRGDAEDLTNVDGVGETVAEDITENTDISTVFDLATTENAKLNYMTETAHTHGENATNLREEARSYIVTELAQEIGMGALSDQMRAVLDVGRTEDNNYGVMKQAEAAYEASDSIMRHTAEMLRDFPEQEDLDIEVGFGGESYSPEALAEEIRSDAYDGFVEEPDLDDLSFLEDTQEIDY